MSHLQRKQRMRGQNTRARSRWHSSEIHRCLGTGFSSGAARVRFCSSFDLCPAVCGPPLPPPLAKLIHLKKTRHCQKLDKKHVETLNVDYIDIIGTVHQTYKWNDTFTLLVFRKKLNWKSTLKLRCVECAFLALPSSKLRFHGAFDVLHICA